MSGKRTVRDTKARGSKERGFVSGATFVVLWIAGTLIGRKLRGEESRRRQRAIDDLLSLAPVVTVFVLGLCMFGLGWVASDLYFIGLVVVFIASIGFVVWLTKVVPWPRQ